MTFGCGWCRMRVSGKRMFVKRRRGMNPPATSQTRLKPAADVSACALAKTMIIIPAIHMDEDLRGFRNLVGLGAELAETMIKAAKP